jgi:uncharacterized protein YfdQ (DUF2303 family)
MDLSQEAIKEIRGLVLASQDLKTVMVGDGQTAVLAIVNGELMDLTHYRPTRPDRKRVIVQLNSVESFIQYVNEHKSPHTRIFASLSKAPYTMTAAIDYHESQSFGLPELITHIAVLTMRTTDEWELWSQNNKKEFDQVAFAEFVQANSLDIVEPNSATMMEIALSLQSNNEVKWKSAVRLDNGAVHFEFLDEARAMAGKDGALEIPELFKLRMAVFRGLDDMIIEARFRYRLRRPSITLFYQLVRPQKLVDAMVLDAMDKVKRETELPVFDGSFEKK